MKAMLQRRYGQPEDVLYVGEIPAPKPGVGEVLVQVEAATVHADVWHVVHGVPYVLRLMGSGLFRPKNPVPGIDLAGTVTAVGPGTTRFSEGDRVFGEGHDAMQWANGGTFAEFAVAPETALAPIPEGVDYSEAAAVATSGYIALTNLRGRATVQTGHAVLINGAAGAVGSVALQIAKARGAHVTAVDRTETLPMLKDLGADNVVDFTYEDPTESDTTYDLIFDVASTLRVQECRRIFTPDGIYVIIGHDHYGRKGRRVFGSLPQILKLIGRSLFDRHVPLPLFKALPKAEAMAELAELLADGALTPVIDRSYPLEEAASAIAYLASGRAQGRILLTPHSEWGSNRVD